MATVSGFVILGTEWNENEIDDQTSAFTIYPLNATKVLTSNLRVRLKSGVTFLSMTTAELVSDLWPPRLSQKHLDEESVLSIGRDHHFLNVGVCGTFVPNVTTKSLQWLLMPSSTWHPYNTLSSILPQNILIFFSHALKNYFNIKIYNFPFTVLCISYEADTIQQSYSYSFIIDNINRG